MNRDTRSRCAIIIMNYRRPANIGSIVTLCQASSRRPEIYVIDNAVDRSAAYVRTSHPDVVYLPQDRNTGAARRFAVSATLPHDLTICIDDDVFLAASQIDMLFDRIERAPHRAHGVWSEGIVTRNGALAFVSGLTQRDVEVPIINRVYGYSKDYLTTVMARVAELGFADWADAGPCDDILFSLCGDTVPLCHAIGPFDECRSSNDTAVAVWKTDGFAARRIALLQRILPGLAHEPARLEAMTRAMWGQPEQAVHPSA